MREEHLATHLLTARKNKKKAAIKGIMSITRNEAGHKRWKRIGNCIRPQRGDAISRVVVPDVPGETMYATREGVEGQASAAIAQRYRQLEELQLFRTTNFTVISGSSPTQNRHSKFSTVLMSTPSQQRSTPEFCFRRPMRYITISQKVSSNFHVTGGVSTVLAVYSKSGYTVIGIGSSFRTLYNSQSR